MSRGPAETPVVESTRMRGLWDGWRRARAERMVLLAVAQSVLVPREYMPDMKFSSQLNSRLDIDGMRGWLMRTDRWTVLWQTRKNLPMPEMMTSATFPVGERVFLTVSTSLTSPSVMLSWAVMTDCGTPFARSASMSFDGVRATVGRKLTRLLRVIGAKEKKSPYRLCMKSQHSRNGSMLQHNILL